MEPTRCVRFTPGTACGGQLSSDEAAERALLTTRRELKRSAPACSLTLKARSAEADKALEFPHPLARSVNMFSYTASCSKQQS